MAAWLPFDNWDSLHGSQQGSRASSVNSQGSHGSNGAGRGDANRRGWNSGEGSGSGSGNSSGDGEGGGGVSRRRTRNAGNDASKGARKTPPSSGDKSSPDLDAVFAESPGLDSLSPEIGPPKERDLQAESKPVMVNDGGEMQEAVANGRTETAGAGGAGGGDSHAFSLYSGFGGKGPGSGEAKTDQPQGRSGSTPKTRAQAAQAQQQGYPSSSSSSGHGGGSSSSRGMWQAPGGGGGGGGSYMGMEGPYGSSRGDDLGTDLRGNAMPLPKGMRSSTSADSLLTSMSGEPMGQGSGGGGISGPGIPPPAPKSLKGKDVQEAKGEGSMKLGRTVYKEEMDDDASSDEDGMPPSKASKAGGKESAPDKRRLDRNAREQRRSKKITSQIDQLRQVLRAAGRPVKSNKSSVLSETADYIRDLQKKRQALEAAGNTSYPGMGAAADDGWGGQPRRMDQDTWASQPGGFGSGNVASAAVSQATGRLVSEHSYRLAFFDGCIPMAIATMDGCFVDGNKRFVEVTSYSKAELLKLTIFNLTAPHDLQDTFSRVSQMLRSTEDAPRFSTGAVMKHNIERGYLAISLVRDDLRRPIYFSVCIISPGGGEVDAPAVNMGTAAAVANLNAGLGPGGMSPNQSFSAPPGPGLTQSYNPVVGRHQQQPQQSRLLQQYQQPSQQLQQTQPDQSMLQQGYHQQQGPNFM